MKHHRDLRVMTQFKMRNTKELAICRACARQGPVTPDRKGQET